LGRRALGDSLLVTATERKVDMQGVRRKWGASVLVAAAVLAATAAPGASAPKPSVTGADEIFMNTAAQGGAFEVASGKLAEVNGQTQAVKNAGQRLFKDHAMESSDLKKLSEKLNVEITSSPSPTQQWQIKQCRAMGKTTAFDQCYLSLEIADHHQDISEYADEVKYGGDPQVKAFAKSHLPMLAKHLRLLQAAAKAG
jgi:putative membrane protein